MFCGDETAEKPHLSKVIIQVGMTKKTLPYICLMIRIKTAFSAILIFIVLLMNQAFSQDRPQGQGPGGRGFGGPGMGGPGAPKIGTITGTVLDDSTSKPVPFAAVAMVHLPDSTVKGGTMTDEKGRFNVAELPPGAYLVRVSFIGYRTRLVPVERITPENPLRLNVMVRLKSSASMLKEVAIAADQPEYLNSIDKKVYNVDKSIVATGGTVTDVLQNIPSVAVDIDGNVALRGSENVTILIDGKPSGMLGNDRRAVLQQIPASAVDQIEVITNPSAKYDAEGMAGIINIKTKRDKFQGTNGSVSAGIGTNDKYNFSVSGNDRTAKRNIYLNYNRRNEHRYNYGDGTQQYLSANPYSWKSHNEGNNASSMNNIRVGTDLYLSPLNTLSISGGGSIRSEIHPDHVNYGFYDSNGKELDTLPYKAFEKQNKSDESNSNLDGNIDYKHLWIKNKGEFTSSVGYSRNKRSDDGSYINSLYQYGQTPYQLSNNSSTFQSLIAQADLSWPFMKAGKLETGVKNSIRSIASDQSRSNYNNSTTEYVNDAHFGDHFEYNEQIIAAYSMYSGKWKKFEYNGGLRAEQTLINVDSRQGGRADKNYLSLFPSLFIKYHLPAEQDLQVSYSRRINRPDGRQLNPFTDFADSLNIRKGNPYLNPEMIHSMELSYEKNWKGNSFTATLYYRHTTDLISRYRTLDTTTAIAVMTMVNYSSSDNIGCESVLRFQLGNFGSVMGSFNLFRNTINGQNVSPELQSQSTQWFTRLNFNGKITYTTSLQLTGNYIAPTIYPNGAVKGMSGVDAGLRQDLWKGKGSLTLNVTDIFFTRKMNIHNYASYFDYRGIRVRESRVGMLTLSCRFGKMDNSQRRKGKTSDQRGSDGGMDSMEY